jgi:hypothetical protein
LHISPIKGGETSLYIASTGPALRFSPFLLMGHIARDITLSDRDFLMRGLALTLTRLGL